MITKEAKRIEKLLKLYTPSQKQILEGLEFPTSAALSFYTFYGLRLSYPAKTKEDEFARKYYLLPSLGGFPTRDYPEILLVYNFLARHSGHIVTDYPKFRLPSQILKNFAGEIHEIDPSTLVKPPRKPDEAKTEQTGVEKQGNSQTSTGLVGGSFKNNLPNKYLMLLEHPPQNLFERFHPNLLLVSSHEPGLLGELSPIEHAQLNKMAVSDGKVLKDFGVSYGEKIDLPSGILFGAVERVKKSVSAEGVKFGMSPEESQAHKEKLQKVEQEIKDIDAEMDKFNRIKANTQAPGGPDSDEPSIKKRIRDELKRAKEQEQLSAKERTYQAKQSPGKEASPSKPSQELTAKDRNKSQRPTTQSKW